MSLFVCHKGKKKHQWAIICFRYPALFQSGFEGLEIQSITWFLFSDVVQSGYCGTGRSDGQMEGPYFITLEKLLFSAVHLDLSLVKKGHHLEELFGNMGATSRCFRSF
jgi:hypothetical protein